VAGLKIFVVAPQGPASDHRSGSSGVAIGSHRTSPTSSRSLRRGRVAPGAGAPARLRVGGSSSPHLTNESRAARRLESARAIASSVCSRIRSAAA
jgi:hypothetical protein